MKLLGIGDSYDGGKVKWIAKDGILVVFKNKRKRKWLRLIPLNEVKVDRRGQ